MAEAPFDPGTGWCVPAGGLDEQRGSVEVHLEAERQFEGENFELLATSPRIQPRAPRRNTEASLVHSAREASSLSTAEPTVTATSREKQRSLDVAQASGFVMPEQQNTEDRLRSDVTEVLEETQLGSAETPFAREESLVTEPVAISRAALPGAVEEPAHRRSVRSRSMSSEGGVCTKEGGDGALTLGNKTNTFHSPASMRKSECGSIEVGPSSKAPRPKAPKKADASEVPLSEVQALALRLPKHRSMSIEREIGLDSSASAPRKVRRSVGGTTIGEEGHSGGEKGPRAGRAVTGHVSRPSEESLAASLRTHERRAVHPNTQTGAGRSEQQLGDTEVGAGHAGNQHGGTLAGTRRAGYQATLLQDHARLLQSVAGRRNDATANDTSIEVRIGRIEMVPAAPATTTLSAPPAKPKLHLSAYLRGGKKATDSE